MDPMKAKSSRREFLSTAALVATANIIAACAPKPTSVPATSQPASAGAQAQATNTPQPATPASTPAKIELWTFVNTHARWYQSMAEDFKKEVNPNFDLTVTEIAHNDMHDKLLVALRAGGVGAPDLSDIEQGRFGGFLRGGDPGLVDLGEWLNAGGYLDKLVASREALYSFQGKIYGIEHGLCPVVLYYRSDIWESSGIDPAEFELWEDFIAGARQAVEGDVKALPFLDHDVLLRQRGSDYFDKDGNVTLDSEQSIETMEWILALRDKHHVADQAPRDNPWWGALKEGKYLSQIGADWYAGFLKDNAPELKGKWKAMPLPAWTKGGLRTSCCGGTGSCIVRTGKHVEECWKFLEFSMLSVEGNVRRFEMTSIFPPFIPAMDDPHLHVPDDYFSGQDLGDLFAELAPSVPPQYQSPYRAELNQQLSSALQAIYDGQEKPSDSFKKIADNIRKLMEEEA